MNLRFAIVLTVLLLCCYSQPVKTVKPPQNAPEFVKQAVTAVSDDAYEAVRQLLPYDAEVIPPSTVLVVTADERELLIRLCVAEVFGMAEAVRQDACLSVISTVFARMDGMIISDGTIAGTLGWHKGDAEFWQFPPYVTLGCDYVHPSACRDTIDPAFAEIAVDAYLRGARGSCDGYLFYNSIPGGTVDCLITDGSQYAEFHTR